MPPRFTIAWILIYGSGLLASFSHPVYGTFTYLFEYYCRPSLRWWGDPLPKLRYNMIASTVLTATYLLRRSSMPSPAPLYNPTAKWLLLLGGLMLAITPFAVSPNGSYEQATDYLKLILFHGLIIGTVRTERAFDGFIGIHMAGSGYWGYEAWRNPRREASRLAKVGSGDTLNDNFAAAHLLTVLPFVAVYLLMAKDRKLQAVALLSGPFILNTFILCNSRGGTLGMLAGVAVALLLARRGHRTRMVGVGIASLVCLYILADPEFIERQQSISNYKTEGTSISRMQTWKDGLRMIGDYPYGTGGKGFSILSPIYTPTTLDITTGQRAPHNTVMLVTAEWSVLGLFLFLMYYASAGLLLRKVRKRAVAGDIWYYRSVAIQVSMVSLFVAGLFSDRLYAEAPYWMGALAVVLYRLQTAHLAQTQPAVEATDPVAVPGAAAAPRPLPVRERPAAVARTPAPHLS
jgi:hypothetical protein